MQGARYESGQDNSPLYDEGSQSLFNNVTHHMELWDVGFSSMFVMEARSLAAVAEALGNRSTERATLLQRFRGQGKKMLKALLQQCDRVRGTCEVFKHPTDAIRKAYEAHNDALFCLKRRVELRQKGWDGAMAVPKAPSRNREILGNLASLLRFLPKFVSVKGA